MKLLILLLLFLTTILHAQVGISGTAGVSGNAGFAYTVTPIISGVTASPDGNTVVVSWTTQVEATTVLACGTISGTYNITGLNLWSGTAHQSVCEGLAPSTTYYFQVQSANIIGNASTTGSSTTTTLPTSIPITGVSVGSISRLNTVSSPNAMNGDTYYNCNSNDGLTYLTIDDTNGFLSSVNSNMSLAKFTAELPFIGASINGLSGFGTFGSTNGVDARSPKDAGLFCMAGNIIMFSGRQLNSGGTIPVFTQTAGTVMWSPDHGATWNNFQNPSTFTTTGALLSPTTTSMFAQSPSTWGSATFVMYCGDDGTFGYTSTCNRQDNANAFIYAIANDGTWNNGNSFYLARVARANVLNLVASDWQCWTGGDGSVDTNWTNNFSSCAVLFTNTGKLGEPSVQFLPALNRYLLLTFYYPNGANNANTVTWLAYESPHPWGTWSLIGTINFTSSSTPPGAYNPIVLNDTAWSGTTPTIMFTGNFNNQSGYPTTDDYTLYYAPLTVTH
ncbi:MAG TPA: hypothetical protein VGF75_07225 [Candidatus Saccharimonadales bacterium]|jgi:hypothetical protein